MRLDVFLAPSELTPAALDGRIVAVIDVLRATTTIAAALHAGARTVIPFVETEDAVRTARQYERGEVKLAGERHMVAIPGFDLGNSPLEFTAETVGQQTVLLTTSKPSISSNVLISHSKTGSGNIKSSFLQRHIV